MKSFSILIAAVFVLLASGIAQAGHLGPAGCGLGFQFFGKDNQILAATTNGSTATQFFGITSGTSGCTDENGSAQLLNFIESNKVALSKEAARGEGQTIASLAKIMGCQEASALGASMKGHFETLFPSQDVSPAHVVTGLREIMSADPRLVATCSPIG